MCTCLRLLWGVSLSQHGDVMEYYPDERCLPYPNTVFYCETYSVYVIASVLNKNLYENVLMKAKLTLICLLQVQQTDKYCVCM